MCSFVIASAKVRSPSIPGGRPVLFTRWDIRDPGMPVC
ncbi:hypothetical protein LEP1GSC105_0137 [Leptospira interrogans str. UI 12758]|uniref:Uncharacterized protein n=1 Tax=Leptospira interrogans str. UI 12758 TaxID=1049938 RepID=A0A0E2DAS9_LEPIR|nr:hypothetical protein LEP1GSC105_0137 [Leptospira interrogans str. UI 12758]